MAHALYRIARWAFGHRWTVLVLWIVLAIVGGIGAATLSGKTSDNFTLPGLESTDTFDLMKERAPGSAPDGAQARIVLQVPEGETLQDNAALITKTLAGIEGEHVAGVMTPFDAGTISEDGRTGFATVQYSVQGPALTEADRELLEEVSAEAESAGLEVAIGGDALQEIPETGVGELVGVVIALFVLILTFGSLLSAGLPLVTALIGVGIGVAGVYIATGFMDLGSTTPILALMLGLAVGIDYALFIVSRYRHELSAGHEPREAAGRAVGTAGSAVVVAGLTVVIALVGLSVVGISFLTEMGLAAAGTVSIAVLIAITLLPALFAFAGDKLGASRSKFLRKRDPEQNPGRVPFGKRWAEGILRHPWITFIVGIAAAGLMAVPALSMQLALPDDGMAPEDSESRHAFDLIAEEFTPGLNGPLLVVVDTAKAEDPQAAIQAVTAAVAEVEENVAYVVPPGPLDPEDEQAAAEFAAQVEQTQFATITVIPTTGPSDEKTPDLVDELREVAKAAADDTGAEAAVTGQTAVSVDVSESLADAFPRYLAVIVGLALILLITVFRSILVPVKAIVGFMASIFVSLGLTVAVFQWGWGAGLLGLDQGAPLMSLLPILLTGILFGLAMDYEFFLVTRIREEHVHGADARSSITHGFEHGARVVTAAAIIMISVFGSFAFADDQMVKAIGFALAVGILADAFLVRMILVPAVMAIVGERMWSLPKWLDRLVPNIDMEGEKLTALLDDGQLRQRRQDEPQHASSAIVDEDRPAGHRIAPPKG